MQFSASRHGQVGRAASLISWHPKVQCCSSYTADASSREWQISGRQRSVGRIPQRSSRRMQILKADEHSYWGQGAAPVPPLDISARDEARSGRVYEAALSKSSAAVVPVQAARFHSIVGAGTVSELLQELLEALADGRNLPISRSNLSIIRDQMLGAEVGDLSPDSLLETTAVLPAHVVEVSLAKTAGWALDRRGAPADPPRDTDPAGLHGEVTVMELLQRSLVASRLEGYSLDDVASVLWSLASILEEYGWTPAAGSVEVVQAWLGSSETIARLEGGAEAGRFSVLTSLLWGYAALLRRASSRSRNCSAEAAEAAEASRKDDSSGDDEPHLDGHHHLDQQQQQQTPWVPQAGGGCSGVDGRQPQPATGLGHGLDSLARRAVELVRAAYGSSEPVAAVELADVAWALSVIGHRSPAMAQLAEAVAHEVYRQLSNRSSLNSPFEPADLVKVVRAYADMGLSGLDGSVSRMLDAVGSHVTKRIRSRHVGAITRPADCAELLRGFADLGHNTVVVPELLKSMALQISREVATHNIAAPRGLVENRIHNNAYVNSSMDVIRMEQEQEQLERRHHYHQALLYWYWSSFLEPRQAISVLTSYTHFGYSPGADLVHSVLLALQPQLFQMSAGEIAELLQVLAATRHVPGPQTLALLASAALCPTQDENCGQNVAANRQLMGSSENGDHPSKVLSLSPSLPSSEEARQLPLQKLSSLWALVMMGWQPEAHEADEVMASVLLDDTLKVDIQDVGRMMSIMCVLHQSELTIQRFGIATMKLRDALAAAPSSLLRMAATNNGNMAGDLPWRTSSYKRKDMENVLHQQLRPTLIAAGVAMTLLGAEGWEMAEQVLPTAYFRLVEQELGKLLQSPNDGVDDSCVADAIHALSNIGIGVVEAHISLPVESICPSGTDTGSDNDGVGSSRLADGVPEGAATIIPEESIELMGDTGFGSLKFKRLVVQLPSAVLLLNQQGSQKGSQTLAKDPDITGHDQQPPSTKSQRVLQMATHGGIRSELSTHKLLSNASPQIMTLQVCSSADYASNAPEDILWGWVQVRQVLTKKCLAAKVLVLPGEKVRRLKRSPDDLHAYIRFAMIR